MNSSGTLRSRFPSAPSSPLTDKKIAAYALTGRYGPVFQKAIERELKAKEKKKKKKPSQIKLHKNSLALTDISHLL